MNRLSPALLALLLPFALAFSDCGDKADDTSDPEADADTDSDADTDADSDADSDADTDADTEDTDGDGVLDKDEPGLGTDPNDPDSDDDTLQDGAEQPAGADPTNPDTDGDGYLDGWEVTEGKDPADATSLIYQGHWPYNPDKDSIVDPGFPPASDTTKPGPGDTLPRFAWVDQYGDTVDIYDFAGQGKDILIDVSAVWCSYCKEMAKWLDGQDSYFDGRPFAAYKDIPTMVNDGTVQWVTILDQNAAGRTITERDLQAWYSAFPNPLIPILADTNQDMYTWLEFYGYPTVFLVDENMQIVWYVWNGMYTEAWDETLARN